MKSKASGCPSVLVSRSPCGERGLKFVLIARREHQHRRSPCGERGLKLHFDGACRAHFQSLPVRGAWIEIYCSGGVCCPPEVAPRAGSVD